MAKVVLSEGKEVEISNVSFNKEQKINITKTYITTVKKAVAKVCRDFYSVAEPKQDAKEETIFNDIPVQQPALENVPEPLAMPTLQEAPAPVVPEVATSIVTPVVNATAASVPTAVASVIPEPAVNLAAPEPVQVAPVVAEIPSVVPEPGAVSFNIPVEEPKPVPVAPQEATMPVVNPVPTSNTVEPIVSNVTPVVENVIPAASTEAPAAETAQSFFDAQPIQNNGELVFDASNETNFNNAMNQGNGDVAVAADNLDSLRAFGVDGGANAPVVETATAQVGEENQNVKTKTLSKGFANSKIVTVIGVILFVLACIFMGYEIFNYVNIVK